MTTEASDQEQQRRRQKDHWQQSPHDNDDNNSNENNIFLKNEKGVAQTLAIIISSTWPLLLTFEIHHPRRVFACREENETKEK